MGTLKRVQDAHHLARNTDHRNGARLKQPGDMAADLLIGSSPAARPVGRFAGAQEADAGPELAPARNDADQNNVGGLGREIAALWVQVGDLLAREAERRAPLADLVTVLWQSASRSSEQSPRRRELTDSD